MWLVASIDWGDAPTWIAGVATVMALAFAATAAQYARRTYEIESARDRLAEEARQAQSSLLLRAQSTHLSAWWGESTELGEWGVFVRNGSEAPVFHVHVTVLAPDTDSAEAKEHVLVVPPGTEPSFYPIVIPGDTSEHRTGRTVRRVRVSFTDAAGIRWTRDQHGRLRRFESVLSIKTDPPRAVVLGQFAPDFLRSYGVTVEFEVIKTGISDDLRPLFAMSSREGDSADALIGAHDWIAGLARQGLIEHTVLSDGHRAAFRPWTLAALTFENRLYGVPTTLDTTALIRNADLVKDAPATMEELIATGHALRRAARVSEVLAVRVTDEGDPFQLWPMFASAGGELFARTNGAWNPDQIRISNSAAVAAFDRLRSLGECGDCILRRSMDKAEAFELFATLQTPFLISTSDGLAHAMNCGIPVKVSPVPPFTGGRPARPLALVHGLFMASNGRNKLLAHDLFSDYLSHADVMAALSDHVVCPVALRNTSGQSAGVTQYQTLCDAGDPMPTFPAMRHIWEILGRAQAAAIRGASAEGVAHQAASEISLAMNHT